MAGVLLGVAISVSVIVLAAGLTRPGTAAPGRLTILLLGTDQRPGERSADPGRTDAMVLLSVDSLRQRTELISIPRDLWVTIPGHGEGRINTAYRSGELARRGAGGPLAVRTVADVLRVGVDRYILIDMSGVRELVDILGGIDIVVASEIVDPDYPTDDFGTRRLVIPAGRQHMNGDAALAYVRTRHAGDDFGRMARQQQMLSAIRARATDPANAARFPAALASAQRMLKTNLTPGEVGWLATHMRDLSEERTRRLVIGPELADPIIGADGAFLLTPDARLPVAVANFLARSL